MRGQLDPRMGVEGVTGWQRLGLDHVQRGRAIRPSSRARSNASWSMSVPLDTLTRWAPGLMADSAESSRSRWVAAVAGADTTT